MADTIFNLSIGITAAGMLLAFMRFLKGPSVADRTVALDGLTIMALSLISALGVMMARAIYLDVALVYGLISFIGVIAVARYKEGGLA